VPLVFDISDQYVPVLMAVDRNGDHSGTPLGYLPSAMLVGSGGGESGTETVLYVAYSGSGNLQDAPLEGVVGFVPSDPTFVDTTDTTRFRLFQ
jgi:hypothetical protein